MKKRKISQNHGNAALMLYFMVVGAACGAIMWKSIGQIYGGDIPVYRELLYLIIAFLEMYAAVFLQIAIHEAGHLTAGLLTGYTFSSFRLGNLMWIKDRGTIRFRRLSIAGTGGQCLMNPPDPVDGKIPFVFYNLGGPLMNLVASAVCAALFFCKEPFLALFLRMMCVMGVAFALANGIPIKLGTVHNDGCNAWEAGRSPEALRSFWVQMKVAEQISKGVRLKDMPDEWFSLPDEEGMKNGMTAVMAVFYANRKMDEHAFPEAAVLMDRLLAEESAINGLHRNLLACDRLYCELIGEKNSLVIGRLYSRELTKFMKTMRKFPSVIRTEYAYALLWQNDAGQAVSLRERFEKCAKTYPYASDIESERELLERADAALWDSVRK